MRRVNATLGWPDRSLTASNTWSRAAMCELDDGGNEVEEVKHGNPAEKKDLHREWVNLPDFHDTAGCAGEGDATCRLPG